MFGHQDNAVNENHPAEPVADGMLSNDTNITFAPTSTPLVASVPSTPPAPSAPPVIDDSAASDYIMTDAPHADGTTKPAILGDQSTDDLLNIKQQALQQLSPLIDQLEQTPEDKFRTTMMMIQASDDQSLVGAAYEAAKQISEEKARAQALLDVVNEINYFTQHQATT